MHKQTMLSSEALSSMDLIIASPESKQSVSDNYENLLMNIVQQSQKLPISTKSSYGYQQNKLQFDCVETGFRNLFNRLLYNEKTGKFDFNLLPDTLKPHESLNQFYQSQNFETKKINSREVGQAFMDMVSGNAALQYVSGNYELNSIAENFIPLMNYCFGTSAATLKDLSTLFSDNKRRIIFKEDNQDILIELYQSNSNVPEVLHFHFQRGKTGYLTGDFFKKTNEIYFHPLFCKIAAEYTESYPLLLPLIYSTSKEPISLDNLIASAKSVENLNYLFTQFSPQTCKQAINLIQAAMPFFTTHPVLEKYANYFYNVLFQDKLFYEAIWLNNKDVVKFCLKLGANPNTEFSEKRTPLHIAQSFEVFSILLEAGADIHAKTDINVTTLHFAKNVKTVKLLIERGLKSDATDNLGRTPLHFSRNDVEAVKALIAAGADVNAKDTWGYTPLESSTSSSDVRRVLFENSKQNPQSSAHEAYSYLRASR